MLFKARLDVWIVNVLLWIVSEKIREGRRQNIYADTFHNLRPMYWVRCRSNYTPLWNMESRKTLKFIHTVPLMQNLRSKWCSKTPTKHVSWSTYVDEKNIKTLSKNIMQSNKVTKTVKQDHLYFTLVSKKLISCLNIAGLWCLDHIMSSDVCKFFKIPHRIPFLRKSNTFVFQKYFRCYVCDRNRFSIFGCWSKCLILCIPSVVDETCMTKGSWEDPNRTPRWCLMVSVTYATLRSTST